MRSVAEACYQEVCECYRGQISRGSRRVKGSSLRCQPESGYIHIIYFSSPFLQLPWYGGEIDGRMYLFQCDTKCECMARCRITYMLPVWDIDPQVEGGLVPTRRCVKLQTSL